MLLLESYKSFCQSHQWENLTKERLLQNVQLTTLRHRKWGVSAFTTSYRAKSSIDSPKPVCSHCNRRRHTEDKCWADRGKNVANQPANYWGKPKAKANVSTAVEITPSASLVQVPTEFYAAFTISQSLSLSKSSPCYLHNLGANRHIFIKHKDFNDYMEIKDLSIHMATLDVLLVAKGCGSVLVCFKYKNVTTNFLLKDVLHIPKATENLFLQELCKMRM